MTALFKLSRRSLDELEEELVAHAQRINAEEYAFLELVREFDIRQGWKAYQFNNCAEWLNMKCGIVVGTAREKVRVAAALFDLPKISRAFARGRAVVLQGALAEPRRHAAERGATAGVRAAGHGGAGAAALPAAAQRRSRGLDARRKRDPSQPLPVPLGGRLRAHDDIGRTHRGGGRAGDGGARARDGGRIT